MELKNISDGISDGIVLFYMKNGKLHPVLLTQEQAEMLDLTIVTVFGNSKIKITRPVEYEAIKNMINHNNK